MSTYDCDLGAMAKDILANAKETPWNKEYLDAWRPCLQCHDAEKLRNNTSVKYQLAKEILGIK